MSAWKPAILTHVFCAAALLWPFLFPRTAASDSKKAPLRAASGATMEHAWLSRHNGRSIASAIPPPAGFARIPVPDDSFAAWLRRLPLKPAGSPVLLYSGRHKRRQDVHVAVVDIDVGAEDLQQCADAYMRLVAEYFWSRDRQEEIRFLTVDGSWLVWSQWKKGLRRVGRKWVKMAPAAEDHAALREYLDQVYRTANTASLEDQMQAVGAPWKPQIGDLYLEPANKRRFGHAVVVVDVATDETGSPLMLLAQSYMPAQEVHVLVNHEESAISPWHRPTTDGGLQTPEWLFPPGSLRRSVSEDSE
jgi:hypothetical protein